MSMTLDRKRFYSGALELIQTLTKILHLLFEQLAIALKPVLGIVAGAKVLREDRVSELLQWAESDGPGMAELREVLGQVAGQATEPPDTAADGSFMEELGNGFTLDMVRVSGGQFQMGSPEGEGYNNERPQHFVKVASFWIGRFPVTQAQWRTVANLAKVERELEPSPAYFEGGRRPVERVSWYEAVEFCARLSKHTSKAYRLPSEAEWEYACRGRTTTPYHFGKTLAPELANYGNHHKSTTEVGQFGANAYGLYDMHGNVWEWCLDHQRANYDDALKDCSVWISSSGSTPRICRGGSWDTLPRYCRTVCRNGFSPVKRYSFVGLRVCCSAPRIL